MPPRTTKDLTLALLEQLPQDSSPLVPTVKLERPAAPPKMNGQRQGSRGPAYDPSLLYVLELITVLAIRDDENFATVGELVADAIQNIVRNAINIHSMVLARATFYLLLLLQKSADQVVSQPSYDLSKADALPGSVIRSCSCGTPHDLQLQSAKIRTSRHTRAERCQYLHQRVWFAEK